MPNNHMVTKWRQSWTKVAFPPHIETNISFGRLPKLGQLSTEWHHTPYHFDMENPMKILGNSTCSKILITHATSIIFSFTARWLLLARRRSSCKLSRRNCPVSASKALVASSRINNSWRFVSIKNWISQMYRYIYMYINMPCMDGMGYVKLTNEPLGKLRESELLDTQVKGSVQWVLLEISWIVWSFNEKPTILKW